MSVSIVNYGMGNIGSIVNMFKYIGHDVKIASSIHDIEIAEKLILPGVGNFNKAITNIKELGILDILNKKALIEKVPVLGICLGMQLFAIMSEEGNASGLGWIKGYVRKFKFNYESQIPLKIPHMGWNKVKIVNANPILNEMNSSFRFYFVHSYHFECEKFENIIGLTEYGYDFASVIAANNIIGVQFHPEKSHKFGLQLLKNFIEYK